MEEGEGFEGVEMIGGVLVGAGGWLGSFLGGVESRDGNKGHLLLWAFF